jgi:Asp-tRNA(Asn)/Glu-tRNA(Gln) amidotransferase A subunit family amidase
MQPSTVDLRADVDRRRSLARDLSEGGPWVRWNEAGRDEAAAGGRPAGPLERTLVGVKDLVAVAGLPLGAGTRARSGAAPEPDDAVIVARLRAAGAVVLGTVALHELAFGTTGINDQVGFPGNPVDPERIPGGSSSGSAVAVADGSCDLAVGTDTGGSVRIPAALCGVVGFKPARGTYPTDGVLPLSPRLDHVGLLARTVERIAGAHQALTGGPAVAATSLGQVRLGVDRAGLETASAPVAGAIEGVLRVLADAGCELVDVAWPDADRTREVSTTVMFAEAAEAHLQLLAEAGDLIGPDVAARLRQGAAISPDDHRAAVAEAEAIEHEVRTALAGVDAGLGPTVPVTAPTIAEARDDPGLPAALVSATRLANLAGVPALSLPAPVTVPSAARELPIGLQVVAATDTGALGVGLALQRLSAW